jgi:simple sugar transport system permease protein
MSAQVSTAPRRLALPAAWKQKLGTPTALMFVVTALVFVIFSVISKNFFTAQNLTNIAVQVAPVAIVAVAGTFVITAAMIDLSTGSILALVGVVGASLLASGVQSALVILICIGVGGFCGLVNGWFSTYQGMPSFIVTLATMSVLRGIALLMTKGFSIAIPSTLVFAQLGQSSFLGLGLTAWVALVCVVIGGIVFYRMRFGQYITGIGSNEESVRRAGVRTNFVKMMALTLSGAAAGLAGVITAARLGSGDANSGFDFALTVITAVVLGGTDLLGGRGSVIGTVIGAVLIGVITNGLVMIGMSAYVVPIVTGSILLIVIWINLRGKDLTQVLTRIVTR